MSDLAGRIADLTPEQRARLQQRVEQRGRAPRPGAVAVISMACRLPGGVGSPDELWDLLVDGRDAVTGVPADRWDGDALDASDADGPGALHTRWGAFLDDVDGFDAAFFGISPREAGQMDPQQRLLLETAWETLERGGQPPDRLAGSATGVFVGAHNLSSDYYLLQLAQSGGLDAHSGTGSAHSILANRISYLLDLRGPSMTVDTACSSSLVAVHLACHSLRAEECDLALAGGANLMLLPPASAAFSKLQILSGGGRCRTFDAAADGIARGEGIALVALKRLEDARRDGDPILAVIAGTVVNQDGASNGLTAPNGAAQVAGLRRLLDRAGIDPSRVGLVETHGTGTALGDPIEVEALHAVIGPERSAAHRCHLGAAKTNFGHLEAAAGILGLVKAVLCLDRRQIPPNLNFTELNPHIDLDGTPFVLPHTLTDWPAGVEPRVALVSGFGFGGTNAFAALEEHVPAGQGDETGEAPATDSGAAVEGPVVLPLSARSAAALDDLTSAHAARLRNLPPEALADYVHTASAGRSHLGLRRAVVGDTPAALAAALDDRLHQPPAVASDGASVAAADVVFVYSGQGGQWPGMGRELFDTEEVFRAAVVEVASRFRAVAGWDLLPVLTDPAEAPRLADTAVAQPALLAMQVGLTELWRDLGVRPAAIVAHSVGEVAAAHVAGALSLDDAVQLIWHRSRLMQPARGAGGMVQVECSADELADVLSHVGNGLSVAALNGPTSTVVSGDRDALAALEAELTGRGRQVRPLPVEYAFHSAQMEPFGVPLRAALAELRPAPAQVPFASTVTGTWSAPGDFDADYWVRNVRRPVRFHDAVTALLDSGFTAFVEIGAHPALGAAIHAAGEASGKTMAVTASLRRERPARASMLAGLATLYEAGCSVDWARRAAPRARIVDVPTYPWQHQRHWLSEPDPAALAFNVTGRRATELVGVPPTEAYEVAWEPVPAAGPTALAVDVGQLAPAVDAAASRLDGVEALDDVDDTARVEARAVAYAWSALDDLGIAHDPGDRLDPAAAARRAGIVDRHERLWGRVLALLGAAGLLRPDGDGWVVTDAAPPERIEPERIEPERIEPDRIETALLDRCGAALAAVLRGEADPLALLFPAEGVDGQPVDVSAEAIYSESATALVYNRAMAAAVAAIVGSGDGRPVEVVELGAGTGATTAAVLPTLPAGSRYCFTDLSPAFFATATERFGGGEVDLTCAALDVERPPAEQGFDVGTADIVLASNVVHATGDIRQALGHARSLLRPGGALVLLETVASMGWHTLTFGLTSGWWRFRDADLRVDAPVLPADRWVAVAQECGFDAAVATAADISTRSLHPQVVVIARADHGADEPAGAATRRWLVVADRGGVGEAVASLLRGRGAECTVVAAAEIDDAAAVLAAAVGAGGGALEIVHCGALDLPDVADTDEASIEATIAGGLGAVVPVARAVPTLLTETGGPTPGSSPPAQPRLWLATRGAQPVDGDAPGSPLQAPLWGFARSLALEIPDRFGGIVDVGAGTRTGTRTGTSTDAAAAVLLAEVLRPGGEDQIAWRGGRRLAARLARLDEPPAQRPVLTPDGAYVVTGGLGSLGGRVAAWLGARGARHVVLVSRSELPPRARWEALDGEHPHAHAVEAIGRLEAAGIAVQVARADVADRASMTALFDELDAAGRPVRGVVHSAAAYEQTPLAELSPDVLRRSLTAKVTGSWVLHELTRRRPLDLFVLFSSITSLLGAKGLSAYASANEFLGALAATRRAAGLPATCVDWGTWIEPRAGAVARRGRVADVGFVDLDEERAFELLDGLVAAGTARAAVACMDWERVLETYGSAGSRAFLGRLEPRSARHQRPDVASGASAADAVVPRLAEEVAALAPPDRAAHVAAHVRADVARVLGLPDASAVGATVGFFDLGLDSLMAVQLRQRLEATTGLSLPATALFNHPNADALAAYLVELLDTGVDLPIDEVMPDQPPADAIDEVMPDQASAAETIDELSDDDVRAALLAELEGLSADLRGDGAAVGEDPG